ncbi:TPA: family 78 glycoside hydrolase catalytic domain [Streptococcus suis]|nr:family 78 glycoside hydrolase catalytic domain [Streptococcus suis]HEL2411875.1 family 78 glycoside hydrolase catalytic domain [Streptococcus suis]
MNSKDKENNMLFKGANWITRRDDPTEKEFSYFQDHPNMIFEKSFEWFDGQTILLHICGLGYYTAFLNGKRIGNDYLNSDVTNYDKMVYYDTYDLSEYVKPGQNLLSIELGNGWYNPAPINILGKYNVRKQLAIGKPCVICDIQIGDEHIVTDNTWNSRNGNLLQNSVYIGEVYSDQTVKSEATNKTVAIPGPAGRLVPSFIPKVKRHDWISPKKIEKKEEVWYIDFGQIISGQIAFTVTEGYVGTITIQYAEDATDDAELNFSSTISGRYGLTDEGKGITSDKPIIQEDKIIKTQPNKLQFSNQYTYHSFRYARVEANSEDFPLLDIRAYRVHTAVEEIIDFETSSEYLNDLWLAGKHTRLHNIHSYFEDCSRERLGYGGDIVALLQSHLHTVDARNLLKKVFLDFVNDQRLDGGITQTAPYVGIMTNGSSNGSGSLGWQLVLPQIALSLYDFYSESNFVEEYAFSLESHLTYLLKFNYEYIKSCCLGDWGSIDEIVEGYYIKSPDQDFCSACMYLLNLKSYLSLCEKVSRLYPYQEQLKKRISDLESDIINEFYDRKNEVFSSGSASSIIFAIKTGLVSDLEYWYRKLVLIIKERKGIFPFGIFGMSWSYEELAKRGGNQLILEWLLRKKSPSYYDMIKTGNQTLSEHFGSETTFLGSKNHAMFSSYSSWLVREVLGLKLDNQKICIRPEIFPTIDWVKGCYHHPGGVFEIERFKEEITVKCPKQLLDLLEFDTNVNLVVLE